MRLTTDCTESDQASIGVLTKLDKHPLHICTVKKKHFQKTDTSSDSKTDSQLQALQQMSLLTRKIEDSNHQVSEVKKEMSELKEPQSTSFRKALGNVTPGRIVSVPEEADKSILGVIIRGIPEEQGKPIDRTNTDLAKVDAILSFLDIEDRKPTKAVRLGKYDQVRKKNRPLLVKTASDISKNLIL